MAKKAAKKSPTKGKVKTIVSVDWRKAELDPMFGAGTNDFDGLHGINPELVSLIDYMVKQESKGAKGVTLEALARYAENVATGADQLVNAFGKKTTLDKIAKLGADELEDKGVSL